MSAQTFAQRGGLSLTQREIGSSLCLQFVQAAADLLPFGQRIAALSDEQIVFPDHQLARLFEQRDLIRQRSFRQVSSQTSSRAILLRHPLERRFAQHIGGFVQEISVHSARAAASGVVQVDKLDDARQTAVHP